MEHGGYEMNSKLEQCENRPQFTDFLDYPCKWNSLPSLASVREIRRAIIWLLEDINSDKIEPGKGMAMLLGFNALMIEVVHQKKSFGRIVKEFLT